MIPDYIDIARFLIEGTGDTEAMKSSTFQLGIDMLIRIGKPEEVFQYFIKYGMINEAINFVFRYKVKMELINAESLKKLNFEIKNNPSLLKDFLVI